MPARTIQVTPTLRARWFRNVAPAPLRPSLSSEMDPNARRAPSRSASRGRAPGRHGEGGLIFAGGNPNDARLEVGLGVLYRVDLRQHDIHRYGRVPFLDLSQQHSARGIARVHRSLGP